MRRPDGSGYFPRQPLRCNVRRRREFTARLGRYVSCAGPPPISLACPNKLSLLPTAPPRPLAAEFQLTVRRVGLSSGQRAHSSIPLPPDPAAGSVPLPDTRSGLSRL